MTTAKGHWVLETVRVPEGFDPKAAGVTFD
ncbi:uncharacterized protein METZ01_LOCUS229330 [marine metagenome]|uniref:Uncharacterized protein n=1 Tax=marine metagenome TaxID=408172 RepID=A0A382GMX6_9ZZZZ